MGAKRRLKPTWKKAEEPLRAAMTWLIPARPRASGFSTSTGFPASSARAVRAAWLSWWVAISTALMSGLPKTASASVSAAAKPKVVWACSAVAPLRVTTVCSATPSSFFNSGRKTARAKAPAPMTPSTQDFPRDHAGCREGRARHGVRLS